MYDLIPLLDHLAQKPGDVRREIERYGTENTAVKFNQVKSAQLNMINSQRQKGIAGAMTG